MSAPELRTTRDMIRGVADAWKEQYKHGGSWSSTFDGSSKAVWSRLKALDVETATVADVEAIIGNASWTSLKCNQCGQEVDTVVQLGESPDYESRTVDVCADCLRAAFALIEGARI